MAPGWRIAFLLPVYIMCFCLSFLQVDKAFIRLSSAWLMLWHLVYEKVSSAQSFAKVVCCQKLRYAGGCEDGADLGKLAHVSVWARWPFKVSCPSCLRLVLCRRQPMLWFERDLRFEYWLSGSCKCSFSIFSSRVGGSAHLVWCFKTPLILRWYLRGTVCCHLYQENSYRYNGSMKLVASLVLHEFSMVLLMVDSFPT